MRLSSVCLTGRKSEDVSLALPIHTWPKTDDFILTEAGDGGNNDGGQKVSRGTFSIN